MRHALRVAARLAAVAAALWLAAVPALAVNQATVTAGLEAGFARLVFEFSDPVQHQTTVANNVLVISLSGEIDIDLTRVTSQASGYIAAARLDPDRATLRFALGRSIEVSTIAARERLYVDLLPESWVGPPPGLPEEVVGELIRLAREEAEREAARARTGDAGRELLEVHIGHHPTFSRIVFDWSEPTGTVLSREDDTVMLEFDREADPDLTALKVDPPPQLLRSTMRRGEGTLTVVLEVEPGTDVRGFREDQTFIVDLSSRDRPATVLGLAGAAGSDAPSLPPVPLQAAVTEMDATSDRTGEAAPAGEEAAPAGGALVEITVSPLDLGGGAAAGGDEPSAGPGPEEVGAGGEDPEDAQPAASGAEDAAAADDPWAVGDDGPVVANTDPDAPVVVSARIIGSTLRLRFPFAEPIASAAFQRARTLWLVFDAEVEIDAGAVEKAADGMVTGIDQVATAGMRILRMTLADEFLATSAAENNQWVVSIGDLVLAPTQPLALERAVRSDGHSKVSVELARSGRVHWIADRAIGDRLAVVTLFGPPRGQIKRQEFVEFTALPTAHGLAIRPHADDLSVRLAQDEVVITRERGLAISAGRWPVYDPAEQATVDATRPGFVPFHAAGRNPVLLRRNIQGLISEIAELPAARRANARQRLARLLLANEMGAEALGTMELAEEEDPEVVNDPVFHAMRGIARLMVGRLDAARQDLWVHGLDTDPHVALWRALVEAGHGNWAGVIERVEAGSGALQAYPPARQAPFRLAAARAGLETGEVAVALVHLEALAGGDIAHDDEARRDLLSARLAELEGDVDDAMEDYDELAASQVRPVAAEAEYRRIALYLRTGRMTLDAAIPALESLQASWRGDLIELHVLRKLAELYGRAGRYRDALETMKVAIVHHEESELTRLIADEMTTLFNHIYLDDGAGDLAPIDALGLYYDFRELTPVGRRGDEMIRKLAQRLIDVDLLDQAADLLEHQVANRLTGIARAQVAADLSLTYLMGHKPELALRAIRQTRQAVLPERLQDRRNILEARALADLGRVELAVEILDTMSGPTIERLKADALWRGQRWQDAGEQIERVLGARWQTVQALTDAERLDVLRAGIAYALADDALGLDRLRRKYVSKMSSSPDSGAFDMVTGGIGRDADAVNALAKQISETDMMEEFVDELRAQDPAGGEETPDPSSARDAAS